MEVIKISSCLCENWSQGWLPEGHYIKYYDNVDRCHRYAFIERREFSHLEYTWEEEVDSEDLSGPQTIDNLEITIQRKQVWQFITGFKIGGFYYFHIPSDTYRHGVAKRPRATSGFLTTGHYEEWMSPWDNPDWSTEHFLISPMTRFVAFSYYNPFGIAMTPQLNFFINKCNLTLLGYEQDNVLYPSKDMYREILDKLYRKVVPHRPITLMPVKGPAEYP